MITASMPIRIARPSRDLAAAERFYVWGLGLAVQFRSSGENAGEHALLMVGPTGAAWHLELVASATAPTPSPEDLLVLYLGAEVPPDLIGRLERVGGTVMAQSGYWDRWGVTVRDPDGYRLVLSTRVWCNDGS